MLLGANSSFVSTIWLQHGGVPLIFKHTISAVDRRAVNRPISVSLSAQVPPAEQLRFDAVVDHTMLETLVI